MTVAVLLNRKLYLLETVQGFVCIGELKTTSSEDMFACVDENY